MDRKRVTISIPDAAGFEKAVVAAQAKGLEVEKALPKLGIVTGAIAAKDLAALRGVPGLDSVEEERTYGPA